MNTTNQLPPSEREAFEAFARNCPMGKYSIFRRGDGYESSHTQLMWDAWQARAQVQGELEPYDAGLLNDFGGGNVEFWMDYIRAELGNAHDFYQSQIAAPQPAQATQAVPMTDAVAYAIHQVIKPSNMTDSDWHSGAMLGHENEYREKVEQAATRAILALRPQQSGLTGCNCRWNGDTQVQWCELHLAHKDAIHEWAERAKEAEKQLAMRPELVPMTDTQLCEALNIDGSDDWTYQVRDAVESHHFGITAQAKKEKP